MALKVKTVERKIKFNKNDEGVYRYVMQPELYIALTQAKVIKEAPLRSGCSQRMMPALFGGGLGKKAIRIVSICWIFV